MDILSKPANELRELILSGTISIVDLIDKVYERIMKLENKVNAFITLRSRNDLLKEAGNKEKEIRRGTAKGLLFGIPVAVKDNISTEGIRTTCGSKILENYVPPYDATVVKLLKKEGAIIIGKTNMDEFAMGSSTETSYFGPTRNPWDLERVPGGSSGGSAAVLAAGIVPLALGSDTGGSVRCPAAFTATVGLKPTYGLVSRYGLIAYANSLEQIGPMARNVTDVALLLNVISKYDENDGTSIPGSRPDYMYSLSNPYHIKGSLKAGLVVEMMGKGVSDEVRKVILRALDKISGEGIEIEEVSLSSLKYALPAYYIIAMSEASSNLARYDGVRYGFRAKIDGDWNKVYMETRAQGFGLEVKRRIIMGTFALSAGYFDQYYLRALKVRTLILNDFRRAFKKFNVLVGPTMPILPFKIGEKIKDPLAMYMCDIETVSANLAGIPAISIPAGFAGNLPVGLQIMTPPLHEELLLKISRIFEDKIGLRNLIAPL
ncbi:MAG: Asp-tRNA(Asn)/Glu-tRNA(Gln) amidotransferase GatCAB subunit A [Thermoprotei archaeon]|nr:MAG: Asp-tRNA(Asn)/Glu-tRNA(Gln) amidotransferase GatCAB subunit A [Thermoprotei archaeon]